MAIRLYIRKILNNNRLTYRPYGEKGVNYYEIPKTQKTPNPRGGPHGPRRICVANDVYIFNANNIAMLGGHQMYKVIVTYRKTGNTYEIKFNSYECAFDYAQTLKIMLGEYVVVQVETTIKETVKENDFTKHIMSRFTRRN